MVCIGSGIRLRGGGRFGESMVMEPDGCGSSGMEYAENSESTEKDLACGVKPASNSFSRMGNRDHD